MIINYTDKEFNLQVKDDKGATLFEMKAENFSCTVDLPKVLKEEFALGKLINELLNSKSSKPH